MKRHAPSPVKASDSVVSRMLAKLLGVPASDALDDVKTAAVDSLPADSPLRLLIVATHGLYPWVASVAADIMNEESTPLAEHLLSTPGSMYVVKDTTASGPESLWLAVADPWADMLAALQRMRCRGLFHTFKVGDDLSMIIAVQLSSCRL